MFNTIIYKEAKKTKVMYYDLLKLKESSRLNSLYYNFTALFYIKHPSPNVYKKGPNDFLLKTTMT